MFSEASATIEGEPAEVLEHSLPGGHQLFEYPRNDGTSLSLEINPTDYVLASHNVELADGPSGSVVVISGGVATGPNAYRVGANNAGNQSGTGPIFLIHANEGSLGQPVMPAHIEALEHGFRRVGELHHEQSVTWVQHSLGGVKGVRFMSSQTEQVTTSAIEQEMETIVLEQEALLELEGLTIAAEAGNPEVTSMLDNIDTILIDSGAGHDESLAKRRLAIAMTHQTARLLISTAKTLPRMYFDWRQDNPPLLDAGVTKEFSRNMARIIKRAEDAAYATRNHRDLLVALNNHPKLAGKIIVIGREKEATVHKKGEVKEFLESLPDDMAWVLLAGEHDCLSTDSDELTRVLRLRNTATPKVVSDEELAGHSAHIKAVTPELHRFAHVAFKYAGKTAVAGAVAGLVVGANALRRRHSNKAKE